MASRRLPGRRAGIGGGLTALGEFMQTLLSQEFQDSRQKKTQDAESQRALESNQRSFAEKLGGQLQSAQTDPNDLGSQQLDLIRKFVGDPNKLYPSQEDLFANVVPNIGANTTDPQIAAMLQKGHVKTAPLPGPNDLPSSPIGMGMAGGQTDNPNGPPIMPSTPSVDAGAMQRPILDARAARDAALASENAAGVRKAKEAGAITKEQGLGTAAATHESFPTALADSMTKLMKEGPLQATNAGLTSGAQARAVLAPDIIKGEADKAGKVAASTAAGQQPYMLERERVAEGERQKNRILLDDYHQANDITTSTKTMMEGAKMVLPHIGVLRDQATALDKAGLFGPIMSRVRDIAAKAGTIEELETGLSRDPTLQKDKITGQFATNLGLMASGAARVHGGARGGGNSTMLEYMKGLLSADSTLPMFLGRMDGVQDYMEGYAAGPKALPKNVGPQQEVQVPKPPSLTPGITSLLNRGNPK